MFWPHGTALHSLGRCFCKGFTELRLIRPSLSLSLFPNTGEANWWWVSPPQTAQRKRPVPSALLSRVTVGDTSLMPVIQTLQGLSEACSAVGSVDHSALTHLLQPGVMLWWEGGEGYVVAGETEGRKSWEEGERELLEEGSSYSAALRCRCHCSCCLILLLLFLTPEFPLTWLVLAIT